MCKQGNYYIVNKKCRKSIFHTINELCLLGYYVKMFVYFEKEELVNTPSLRDGINGETETQYRKEGINFIRNMGEKLSLGYNTIATAVVYFQRFYMAHSFTEFPLYITACSSLFLAGKAEETPKRSKDLLKAAWDIFSNEANVIIEKFGETPRESVMKCESVLLQTVNFEFDIEHPYKYLVKYAKYLKGEKTKIQTIVQMAWNFVNDSLSTTLCLEWEPEVIAIALINVSAKLNKFKIDDWKGRKPNHTKWCDLFILNLDNTVLEDIGLQILDLYSPKKKDGRESEKSPLSIASSGTPSSSTSSPNESLSMPVEATSNNVVLLPGLPPVDLSVPPPVMFSTPPPQMNVFVPPPVHLPVPSPVNSMLPPVPVNLSVPPPNFFPKQCNFNVSSPLPVTPVQAFKQKINYSCFSTPDSPFNNQLSYSTKT
ncbi:cyclin-K-like isoform X2 [Leptopilina boulardi]|uniref:cyclin-K-like isoform X2 n=1 Tax=Leptopilina boulardi TaxID=63433 RepID=UPI0021F50C64|nr:cyclin-K-like isoform X2 [Leptopilina boulardi]